MTGMIRTTSYPERILKHYELSSDADMEKDVREGRVVIGKLLVFKRWSTMLRFVRSPLFPCDVIVESHDSNLGRVYHSDIVAIKLLPTHYWTKETSSSNDVDDSDSTSIEDEHIAMKNRLGVPQAMPERLPDGRPVLQVSSKESSECEDVMEVQLARKMGAPDQYKWTKDLRPIGSVRSVLHRDLKAHHVGCLAEKVVVSDNPSTFKTNYYYRFQVYDQLFPQLMVHGSEIPVPCRKNLSSYLFLLCIKSNEDGTLSLYKGDFVNASIKSVIGTSSSAEANTLAIREVYQIFPECFNDDIEACVPSDFKVPEADELKRMGRRDLRDEFTCTIDPAGSKDLDDALSIRPIKGGGYHVGVHIADVSHFVQPGSLLDKEARRRLTSVYLVDSVYPMLPKSLSNNLCSLNPAQDKYAFSVLFEMNQDGEVVGEWFGKSVIRSRCQLTYEQAQKIIDNEVVEIDVAKESAISGVAESVLEREVVSLVKLLHTVATKLHHRSCERGCIDVSEPSLRFVFDDTKFKLSPSGFFVKHEIPSQWTVKEFMVLANARVAEKIVQYLPDMALLRRHPASRKSDILKIQQLLIDHNVVPKHMQCKGLQELINQAQNSKIYDAVCKLIILSVNCSEYFANNAHGEILRSHFALALQWYTHFTSPIRRYCDVIVHRQLLKALEVERELTETNVDLLRPQDTGSEMGPSAKHPPASDALLLSGYPSRCDAYYTRREIDDIAKDAQKATGLAKMAGKVSEELFMCLYLQALAERSKFDKRIQPVQQTIAYVLKIYQSTMVLYSEEIAAQVDVGFRDTNQLFKFLGVVNNEEAASAGTEGCNTKNVHDSEGCPRKGSVDSGNNNQKAGSQSQKTQGTKASKSGSVKRKTTYAVLQWSRQHGGDEVVIEEVTYLDALVVKLKVKSRGGKLSLDMILLPPWERECYRKSEITIPTSLLG